MGIVSAMDTGENLVCFVDYHQVKWWRRAQQRRPAFIAGIFPSHQVDARSRVVRHSFLAGNVEELQQFVLPLAKQGFGYDQQNALHAFRTALRNDQAGFNGFAQADFVGKDAATLTNASQSKDHRIDLMGVRIDASLALRGSITLAITRPSQPGEILGKNSLME